MVGKWWWFFVMVYNISKYRTLKVPANLNVNPPTSSSDATFQINSTRLTLRPCSHFAYKQ